MRRLLHGHLMHPVERFGSKIRSRPGSTVAIVVDDPSRWTPVREALADHFADGCTQREFVQRM